MSLELIAEGRNVRMSSKVSGKEFQIFGAAKVKECWPVAVRILGT